MEKLQLKEGDYLTRAAALLFAPDPEDYITGAFIKIGYFRSENDLAYHDEVRGIQQVFEVCRTSGTPEPSIRFEGNDLWFVFQFSEDYLALLQEKRHEETSVEASVKTSVKILEFLEKLPDMTLAQIAEELGRSVRAVEIAAAKLIKEGHLKYVGHKKGGHWEVIRK